MKKESAPSLEECLRDPSNCECNETGYVKRNGKTITCSNCPTYWNKIINKTCSKFFILMNEEEKYDARVDTYIYATRHYDGSTKFSTFLYLVAPQVHKKIVDKIIKAKKVNYNSKNLYLLSSYDPQHIYHMVPQECYGVIYDKYYLAMTNSQIANKNNITNHAVVKLLDKAKDHVRANFGV